MEFTREIYWNVGHGFATLAPMYGLLLLAVAIFVLGLVKRLKVYRLGQPLDRTDQRRERIKHMLETVLLQTKVFRVPGAGTAHAFFFWSFFVLFIGTTLIVLQADFSDLLFGIKFLKGTFYKLFSLTLDLAGLTAILMLAGLLVRRYLVRPQGLVTKGDDALMHGLLLAILITGFLIEGARMAVTELYVPQLAAWSPVGWGVATLLAGVGEPGLRTLHIGLWWFHLLLALAFIAVLPYSKFRHILTTSANAFFADRGPIGKLGTVNLEDENTEKFGANELADLRWKDIFDADACTLCKRCQDRCPAYATGKPLSPMQVVNQIGEIAFTKPDANLIETIGREAIWACTTCRACQDICPASIEHVGKIVEMRRNLVLMEGEFPGEEVMAAMEQTEVNGNPLGMGYASRGDWAEPLGVKPLSEDPEVDVLYFVGCYASFDKRNIAVATSFIKLCQAAGIKVGILGKEEKCCGEPMRKMGNEYLYQTLAMETVEIIKGYGVKKIVTTCPHCFNTLTKDYRDFDFDIEVVPHALFLEELVAGGKLPVKAEDFACTYHDSCYLGRHNGLYDAPRKLIRSMGGRIAEMAKNRDQAFCCSAGGGRILAEEKLGERINVKRVQMAVETGAGQLLANCPFCLTMFEDGVKGANVEEQLRPRDIAEVLAERITSENA
ncbi:MAG: 4Fe-4S dicluster domain-containing protein [Desulfobulbus sp.]|jgi:Fe-S oxidoreductase/nitrate reductase gamma subunit|uniref:heterodisulfide reductase-related iron-sulfur binding cluster n=1 Tax=Desulfobulbus sp. TaxID=895 RepID=UPI002842A08D|nr:heterodisulfide reductase-related iron-sulfur binding cluster [Desulfobulbus sp.]MDR2548769.1 4Fe-4S dicluster domain-containing protein [Desulfobulbus sp.]